MSENKMGFEPDNMVGGYIPQKPGKTIKANGPPPA